MVSQEEVDRLELKYYDHDIHRAAFVLPRCFRKVSINRRYVPEMIDEMYAHFI